MAADREEEGRRRRVVLFSMKRTLNDKYWIHFNDGFCVEKVCVIFSIYVRNISGHRAIDTLRRLRPFSKKLAARRS